MVPGLTIRVEGVGNSANQLEASKITFSPDAFAIEVAQQQQIMPTSQRPETHRLQPTRECPLQGLRSPLQIRRKQRPMQQVLWQQQPAPSQSGIQAPLRW